MFNIYWKNKLKKLNNFYKMKKQPYIYVGQSAWDTM